MNHNQAALAMAAMMTVMCGSILYAVKLLERNAGAKR